MSREQCRPVRVEVDGEPVDVIVRGGGPLDDEDRKHLAELVRAARRLAERRTATGDPP